MVRIGRLNHVAVAVKDCLESGKLWRLLGAKVTAPKDLPEHGVKTVFVEIDNTKIELLEPLGNSSPISGFLNKSPSGGMHHMCFEVKDIREMMQLARQNNIRLLSEEPKIGAHGKPVVFFHPKDCGGVLVEVEEV
mmetsp:Transcript_7170/g.21871  ORF Transcript_7170/g.21871 Transcript_7170/m.21871 type:complete len:135 (+) Transcript_7170:134-538(+)|eukprot:CAMPEP_0198723184 /NCGR_PEP_ID=MMETSP1475-20131203/728_1 /TAXON_ID= ORGANISM="Unidentified sp., Strain CCMP1999" /NCGR_SAMPLE_ID=MMETSP1475 /ASSEMBLY_ACC=CAM_ASM_001111 /LENGTH=134 /DNA_ID=CAMNT_0044484223 /DNA_START=102 /DNA_END=506 /DNA_ORIENTATION=-